MQRESDYLIKNNFNKLNPGNTKNLLEYGRIWNFQ
jgi:hypothetical protein